LTTTDLKPAHFNRRADLPMVQGHVAEMATEIDVAARVAYRAAWTKDSGIA
jgi:acyl-CoA dehydrogenase